MLRIWRLLLALFVLLPAAASAQTFVSTPRTVTTWAEPTVTTGSAYASGNAVGTLLTFSNAVRNAQWGGIIQSASVIDKSGQSVPYDLILFTSNPSSTTVTNKSAVAVAGADAFKMLPPIQFSGIVLGAASTNGIISVNPSNMFVASTTDIYGILVTRGAPTYSGASDIRVTLYIMPD